ncbi:hypothetical protein B0H15DRAFT_865342 [Mycena belliarum]|uniref:Uncharacterized protein n=1 Tax=Mycena belliarum TaxID=1033014 RepID=A0AAD6XHY3_9AGAR|nr:hypothetical protein B0H15DRAFT_865342 [Mycena belliae]
MPRRGHMYNRLATFQGNLIPEFKGCFLTVVDTVDDDLCPDTPRTPDIPDHRSVYVLLLQYIPGTDLFHQQPGPVWPVCDDHRMAVACAVCVAWYEMTRHAVFHADFAGRNIILKATPSSAQAFCQDPTCQLRFQVPATLLEEFRCSVPFPIAVIDSEDWMNPPPPLYASFGHR